ncbi:hypothetical protein ESCO_006709 [Escovopsis weberi]|uniref:Ubiquitin interaction domain-containing protein n=1 Tax=Escovopsis weberi TaxID=150374 RepID=A0A0M9VVS7_ESCWE|nr:hypothetical protein ESCO_006709 [Escovopsis weberi]
MDPSDDEISQVIDFAGLNPYDDRSMVISALKNNNRNVETVVMQFFDNPESFRQKYLSSWNEDMFSADREGGTNNAGISFHIESVNQNDIIQGVTPPPPGYAVGAPSRPPSRSNDRSPISRMVDWTANDATGGVPLRSQEDQDMQRALRESAQEAGIALSVPQESGVTDTSTSQPYFGPANRADYDMGSWAMVPVGGSAHHGSGDPKPSLRKRVAGAPAFLVQGQNYGARHRLGGLVTILHEIPLARNIFLHCGAPAANYGYNTKWWEGQAIIPPETLQKIQTDDEMQWVEQGEASLSLEEEMHRLMAFLDSTERSYGYVGALSGIIQKPNGPEKPLFEQLGQHGNRIIDPLCHLATLTSLWDDDSEEQETNFVVLQLDHLAADSIYVKTLYESIDHVMWADALTWNDIGEGCKLAMFKKMGEVVIMQCGGEGPDESLEIPLEFYPAKYMVEQKDEARRIQLAWNQTKFAMGKILEQEKELQAWENDWKYQQSDKRELVTKVRDQWKALSDYLETSGNFRQMEAAGFDTDRYSDYRAAPCSMGETEQAHSKTVEDVLLLAERVLADVEARAQGLRVQLEQIQAKQRFLSRLLTDPDKKGRPRLMDCKRYLLRGVATEKDVIYVCQRLERDLIDLEDEPKPVDQWWRLAFAPSDVQQPVKTEKIEAERVLREIWQETKNPILVYATEESLSTPREPLTDALNLFVRSENRTFRQELSRESARSSEERGRSAVVESLSPTKRKHRADSPDSMNSNRASLGSEDRGAFENPFEDRMESIDTELSELSASARKSAASVARLSVGDYLESLEMAPPLPSRDLEFMDTLTAEESQAVRSMPLDMQVAQSDGELDETLVVDDDEAIIGSVAAKAPEMQERARPPPFMGAAGDAEGAAGHGDNMDMQVQDGQA